MVGPMPFRREYTATVDLLEKFCNRAIHIYADEAEIPVTKMGEGAV